MRASWPYEAAQKGIGGRAVIQCSVDVQGLLQGCTVVSETPEGSGFGGSALLLAGSFEMKPKMVNGRPVAGGVVRIPIVFGDPGGDFVAVDRERLVQVDDGLDGDLGGLGQGAPVGDLGGGEQLPAGVLHPHRGVGVTGPDRVFGEVHEQHDLSVVAGRAGG